MVYGLDCLWFIDLKKLASLGENAPAQHDLVMYLWSLRAVGFSTNLRSNGDRGTTNWCYHYQRLEILIIQTTWPVPNNVILCKL